MHFADPLDESQAYACAFDTLFQTVEEAENPFLKFGRDAHAVIHQIRQHFHKPRPISEDDRQVRLDLQENL